MKKSAEDFHAWQDLMAEVGQFLFTWSQLELELLRVGKRLVEAGQMTASKLSGTFEQRLEGWASAVQQNQDSMQIQKIRAKASELRALRNLVVHGMKAGRSGDLGEQSYLTCVVGGYENPAGEETITLLELRNAIQAVDAVRRSLLSPTHFNNEA